MQDYIAFDISKTPAGKKVHQSNQNIDLTTKIIAPVGML
jgi:hypothetical protein